MVLCSIRKILVVYICLLDFSSTCSMYFIYLVMQSRSFTISTRSAFHSIPDVWLVWNWSPSILFCFLLEWCSVDLSGLHVAYQRIHFQVLTPRKWKWMGKCMKLGNRRRCCMCGRAKSHLLTIFSRSIISRSWTAIEMRLRLATWNCSVSIGRFHRRCVTDARRLHHKSIWRMDFF